MTFRVEELVEWIGLGVIPSDKVSRALSGGLSKVGYEFLSNGCYYAKTNWATFDFGYDGEYGAGDVVTVVEREHRRLP